MSDLKQLPAGMLAGTAAHLEFEFTLLVELAEFDPIMDSLMQRLDEAGCAGTLVGVGANCSVELQFIASARTAAGALSSASAAVECSCW